MEANGQLAGLMPVVHTHSYYGHPIPHLRNWTHPNCFLGQPLVARGLEQEFWRALLAWCDREAGLSLFLHLSHVPAQGPLRDALKSVLAEDVRPAARVFSEERAMLHTSNRPKTILPPRFQPRNARSCAASIAAWPKKANSA